MSGQHSIIPPSSAGIWGKPGGCTGWVSMAQMYPQPPEQAEAAVGEAMHQLGEKMIRRAMLGQTEPVEWIGVTTDNGTIITQDMVEAAQMYAEDVIPRIQAGGKDASYGCEDRVHAKQIHELSFGTVDSWLFSPSQARLTIWDAKFGHVEVEAYENWQGINYAAGLLEQLGINGIEDQNITVEIRIVQPFAYSSAGPIKKWVVRASELRGYFNILEANAAKALGPDAALQSGSHCRFCQARHACPAALKAGLQLFEVSAAPLPAELSTEATAVQLLILDRAYEQVKALRGAFQEQLKAKIKTGELGHHYSLEPAYGRRKWSMPNAEVFALGDMLGVDVRKEQEPITPAQAIKAGLSPDIVDTYSTTPSNGLKLVRDTGSKAKLVFGQPEE